MNKKFLNILKIYGFLLIIPVVVFIILASTTGNVFYIAGILIFSIVAIAMLSFGFSKNISKSLNIFNNSSLEDFKTLLHKNLNEEIANEKSFEGTTCEHCGATKTSKICDYCGKK